MLPNRQTCQALIEEAGGSQDLLAHVHAVTRLALTTASGDPSIDQRILTAGAMLHDIGRAFDHGPGHVPEGIAFLHEHEVDEAVLACVATHMGVGIDPEQASAWGWPTDRSYVPERLEELLICQADNLTAGTRYMTLEEAIEAFHAKGLGALVQQLESLEAQLEEALGRGPAAVAAELSGLR